MSNPFLTGRIRGAEKILCAYGCGAMFRPTHLKQVACPMHAIAYAAKLKSAARAKLDATRKRNRQKAEVAE